MIKKILVPHNTGDISSENYRRYQFYIIQRCQLHLIQDISVLHKTKISVLHNTRDTSSA